MVRFLGTSSLVLALLAAAACKTERPPAAARDAGQPDDYAEPEEDDEIRPVYPEKIDAIPAAVTRVCKALHERPAVRRAECCDRKPGILLTSECERNLAGALLVKGVVLDEGKIVACEAAIEAQHEGCDWVAPSPLPTPAECFDLVSGTRDAGKSCRSTLECPAGMRCAGAGPTDTGRCAPPAPPGAVCNTGVDPLVTYLRQTQVEKTRPPCKGYCDRNRCRAHVELGEACVSNVQCGPDHRCREGTCVEGAVAALGDPCIGGDCADGLRCSEKKCVRPKPPGQACTVSSECLSACVDGTCRTSCETAPILRQLSPPMRSPAEQKKRK